VAVRAVTRGRGRPSAGAHGVVARERILNAARQVFSEVGYAAATYQAIAARAGLTRPAVNHHFRTKRDLYLEVVDKTNAHVVHTGMQKAMAESTLLAQVEAFITAAIDADAEDHSAAAFLAASFLEFQRHPELRTENDGLGDLRAFLTGAVAAAVLRGELPAQTSVAQMADTLLAVLWGVGFYAGFVGTHTQLLGMVEQLRQLLAGIGSGRTEQQRVRPVFGTSPSVKR
jgi:AcrR family transcriptional regulator